MDQPLPLPSNPGPVAGVDTGAGAGDLAAAVAAMVDDPQAWFARALIETRDLDVSAGRVLGARIEDVVDQVFAADAIDPDLADFGAVGERRSRGAMVAFVQAVSRQMSRMEALRAWAMSMLTHDAAYHDCDTEWVDDDGTGRACPACMGVSDELGVDHQDGVEIPGTSPVRQVGMEVSAALGVSPTFATDLVDSAVDQVTELPATWAGMAGGEIDGYKARLITTGTRPLIDNIDRSLPAPEHAAELARRESLRRSVEARVLPTAAAKTAEQLRRQVRRLVLRADPGIARAARKVGTADRRVSRPYAGGDDAALGGIASITLSGPAEDLQALDRALDAAARHCRTVQGDPRNLEQLRFDIVTGLGWSALRSGHFGCSHDHADPDHADPDHAGSDAAGTGSAPAGRVAATMGRRPIELRVTVSLATLLGLDEDPADLDGIGPIPADVALDLAFSDDATWRRLVTDPLSGALLDRGHQSYRPPAAMDSYIRTRDGTCRFPTTLTTADRADLDHTAPFDHDDPHSCPGRSCCRPGGKTAADNLGVLSRRAHVARTHHHWRLEQPDSGTFRWTSPAGHTYTVDPDPLTEPEHIPSR